MNTCCGPDTTDLIIQTENGKVQGRYDKSWLNGQRYCCFLGIPYAKPPVDDLRFRPPEPADRWEGVYDATYERPPCIQYNVLMFINQGDEDCLHLNVYTPKPPSKISNPLPVMVWIHGGAFMYGTGSIQYYAPDFLITGDIILVTLNYRLHMLGFLNLGIEECPGNVGLKDQILALKWVQKNIKEFGGDPNNVTLFGESAGSVSVHFLMLTPLTEGLFCKAILQSGTATCFWGFNTDPLKMAFDIGRYCGYDGDDRKELVQHLKKLSASDLNRCFIMNFNKNAKEKPTRYANIAPSVETIAEGAVIPDEPKKLLHNVRRIPTIMGSNDMDGLVFYIVLSNRGFKKLEKDFSLILKDHLSVNPDLIPLLTEKVRTLYYGEKYHSSSTVNEICNLYTDMFNYHLNDICAEPLIKSNCPLYLYEFGYQGRLNFLLYYNKLLNPGSVLCSNLKGASHADDLCYLFFMKAALMYPPLSKKDKEIVKFMNAAWTNFARTGNPSTENVEWKPCTEDNTCYLSIAAKLEMKSGIIGGERMTKFHQIIDPVAEIK